MQFYIVYPNTGWTRTISLNTSKQVINAGANCHNIARLPDLAPKWVRLAPNGTNPGNFQITESDLKISGICPIWGQSGPIRALIRSPWSYSVGCQLHRRRYTVKESVRKDHFEFKEILQCLVNLMQHKDMLD